MPTYEFRCRTCDDVFEVRRPMVDASAPAMCPDGHADTVKLLSMFARAGSSSIDVGQPTRVGGGGCCGGGCGCAH